MAIIKRALLSVTDKSGLVEFARGLRDLGVEIVSTGGTARSIQQAGVAVREVSEVTGFPEMLDGRLKTIHPRIAGGILAMRSKPDHMQSLADNAIGAIDMVVVNLYQFEKAAANVNASLEELIENIDIGGPTLIRAAAKNYRDVAVVTSPSDYTSILDEMRANAGALQPETHWRLALQAFATTAAYDSAISARLSFPPAPPAATSTVPPAPFAAATSAESSTVPPASFQNRERERPVPEVLSIIAPLTLSLRYGENPHQSAALYSNHRGGIAAATQLHGKELSYNNLVDLDAAWQLIHEFDRPASAIIKHTNPCGCAESDTLVESYRKAFEADPISAFGGVLAFNRTVDADTAHEISKTFIEAITAADYTPEAVAILTAKKNLRILKVAPSESTDLVVKSINGGYLAQTPDTHRFDRSQGRVTTVRSPTDDEWQALEFAWRVCKHVKSNAIVFARPGQTISAGAGQMSRVDSVKVGAMKAVLPLTGTVLASDAYFPFPDGVEEAAKHGITAVIQPGGSVKDPDVIAAADRLGLAMVFTSIRHFRH
jgi:phosphoribosylaminoimidazolecarboxamide formyltransferase/IMP cyclohydrolase